MIDRLRALFGFSILQRYVFGSFLSTFFLCVFGSTTVFLVFDFFERMRVFVKEDSTVLDAVSYMFFKIPMIVHLMTPVAVLIAVLLSIGRLSQLSEITAMRACGVSLNWLARPLIAAGFLITVLVLIAGETIVPWASHRVQEIYELDIRKRGIKGVFSKANFWYRDGNKFYNVGLYDSRTSKLQAISAYELDDSFNLLKRVDAEEADWKSPAIGWTMHNVVEIKADENGAMKASTFDRLPLVIKERPEDFYQMKVRPETLSYFGLKAYIDKLNKEGVPTSKYLVDLAAKLAFPFVNVVVVLIAFPFALTPARSGNMTQSFIAGVTVGFGYHVLHALSTSLGAAELLPVIPAAWTANIILGCVGTYLLLGVER